MSADPEDLARRITALEERLTPVLARIAELDERAGMEAGLRAGIDRDLGRLTTKVTAVEHTVRAIWITQGEQSVRLDEHLTTLLEIRELLRAQATVLAEHGATLVAIAEILHRLPGAGEES